MRLDIHYYLYPLLIFPTYYKILHLHYLPPTKEEVYVFFPCLFVRLLSRLLKNESMDLGESYVSRDVTWTN